MIKIISGGQTGADQAGLEAAKQVGIQTGGWMPYGWATLDGLCPEYATKYQMTECQEQGYKPRTKLNAQQSDGTIRRHNQNSQKLRITRRTLHTSSNPRSQ